MQCRNELCTNKATGRSQYCSPKCRIACHRAKLAELRIQSVTDETEKSVTDESVTQTVTSSLKHYYDNPEMQAASHTPQQCRSTHTQPRQCVEQPAPIRNSLNEYKQLKIETEKNEGVGEGFDAVTAYTVSSPSVYIPSNLIRTNLIRILKYVLSGALRQNGYCGGYTV